MIQYILLLNNNDSSVFENERRICLQKIVKQTTEKKPNSQQNDLVRTTDLKKTFSKSDTHKWSYKVYKITENINDTLPSYRIANLSERYNEAFLKKTEFSM